MGITNADVGICVGCGKATAPTKEWEQSGYRCGICRQLKEIRDMIANIPGTGRDQ